MQNSVEWSLAESCDLVIRAGEGAYGDGVVSLANSILKRIMPRSDSAAVTLQATLRVQAPPASSANGVTNEGYEYLFVVQSSSTDAAVLLKQYLDFGVATGKLGVRAKQLIASTGWVHRELVEAHCQDVAKSSTSVIAASATFLEVMLGAQRCTDRKRRDRQADGGSEDDFSCLVLYLPQISKESAGSGSAALESTSPADSTESVLGELQRIAIERSMSVLCNYLEETPKTARSARRFFLQFENDVHAAKSRELFIASSQQSPLLRDVVSTSTLKVCNLQDLQRAMKT